MTLEELSKRLEEIRGPIAECQYGHEHYSNLGECDVCASVSKFLKDLPFSPGPDGVRVLIRIPKQ